LLHQTFYLCNSDLKAIRTYLVLAALLNFSLLSFSQSAPALRCISLDENDDVTLYWVQPTDTGADFNKYLVYYSSGLSSAFGVIEEVTDFNQTSVLITGSFAGAGRFYLVQVFNGLADTSAAIDTISPMVVGISSTGKRVSLGWNHTGLESLDSVYRVYKRDTSGLWQLMSVLDYPMTAIRDTIGACTAEVTYRIETKGKGGCISRSNAVSKVVVDQEAPRRVNLQCASVDTATGYVNLEWSASKSADTYGYMVFYFEDFTRSEAVFGSDQLSHQYDDFNINALLQPETLSVAPFDSCFDSLANWYNQAADSLRFVTLYIDTISFERCEGELAIKWQHPKDSLALGVRNLGGFRVYRQVKGQSSLLIAELSALDSIFIDSGLQAGLHYSYVMAAVDAVSGKEALSNKIAIDLENRKAPKYFYVSSVKNDHATGQNNLHVLADTTAETATYGLLRANAGEDHWALISKVNGNQRKHFVITDEVGKADQLSYHYKVQAYDGCGALLAETQSVKSVLLEGEKNVRDLINTLSWTEYEGFDTLGGGVKSYELFRVGAFNDEFLAEYARPRKHGDDIGLLRDLEGKVCYYVSVPEEGVNSYGLQDTAVSNLRCFEYPVIAFVPNSFSPDGDGRNDVFEPYVNFVDQENYQLTVFDRSGSVVFLSNNPDEGWSGEDLPNGIYVYHLVLMNVQGQLVEQRGTVHLIR
jgi:gliding motility-associated-like protein